MSVNTMTIEQASAFLSAVVSQMQGGAIAQVDAGNFTSVAQNALRQGYDPLNTAISQVLARTIFSVRPYRGKLRGLMVDNQRYGAITRKINYIDGVLEDDQQLYYTGTTPYVNGQSPNPDQWAIRKPATWQSNFYGAETYQRVTTVWKTQLDTAMQGPQQFAEFVAGQMQNVYDQLEQVNDAKARQALLNLIGGKYWLGTRDGATGTHVIYLFDEYAADTGVTLTASNYMAPDNYKPFVEWLYARIATLTDMMAERGSDYHYNPSVGNIMRHTPKDRLKAYFVASEFNRIQSMAIANVFNKDELRMIDFEPINYWQSSAAPMSIRAQVTVNDPGVTVTGASTEDLTTQAVSVDNVFGILFDEECAGLTVVNEGVYNTGLNAAGVYDNTFFHFTSKIWNDFSENAVVLLLASKGSKGKG